MACLLAPVLQLSFANLMDLYNLLTLPCNGSSDYVHNDHASLLASVSLSLEIIAFQPPRKVL